MIDYKALAGRVERMARSYEERARLAHTAQEDRTGERHAECAADGRQKSMGYFASAQEAHEAYCKAGRELHGEYFNGN